MDRYDHASIEAKWQEEWDRAKAHRADDSSKKPPFYALIEFPYPSGDGLHVGHIRSNTAMDVIARKRRAEGFEVLYPIGWDAFGLPTENYAIKTGMAPQEVTKRNTDTFRRQLKALGFSFDWEREIDTTDPAYYKWTQWIFLKMFEKGLAYKKKMAINWCPKDKIGLANEEVIDGACERCGTAVEKREKEQWMLAITKYADRLDTDLDGVDFLEKIKIQQRNWIGKSEGARITFPLRAVGGSPAISSSAEVFTTRPDTLFGASYLVLAPEHALLAQLRGAILNWDEVSLYAAAAKKKSETERTGEGKEKTGVRLQGVVAVNPANSREIPVFIADYVLADYGTGAIMAVPAHDKRDFDFARAFCLPITHVVAPETGVPHEGEKVRKSVIAVVVDPRTKKALKLRWGKESGGRRLFVGGGIEEGESFEEAGRREVAEETGYTDLTFRGTSGTVFHHYYSGAKKEYRLTEATGVMFELASDSRRPAALEPHEADKFSVEWTDLSDSAKDAEDELHHFMHSYFLEGEPYTGQGTLINSGEFSGMRSAEAGPLIATASGGELVTTFKLRDWIFSRQRYWGEPIPLVYCDACERKTGKGWIPVKEEDLPVVLPPVKKYQPTDDGESPLASIEAWVATACPSCGGPARRETDTMPNWAGSSWYFLRYVDPRNAAAFAGKDKLSRWLPVSWYNGGMEHTTLHLLYSRFWHKFLFDLGLVPTSEPYAKRTSHGLILAAGGVKMSKSKGNVINPDEIVARVGADSLRLYEMFMGPFDQPIAWSQDGIVGTRRFLERVWRLKDRIAEISKEPTARLLNETVKKVSDDIEAMRFNTAISALMIFLNAAEKEGAGKKEYKSFLKLLSPFAPHITEELWKISGGEGSVHAAPWPSHDAALASLARVRMSVQVDGKRRAEIEVGREDAEPAIIEAARSVPEAAKWLAGKQIRKTIVIPGKIISFVTG